MSDGEREYSFPSVVGIGQDLRYRPELGVERKPTERLALTVDNRKYFVGDLAIRQSGIASRSLDADRSQDQNVRVLVLAALSLFAQWDAQVFHLVTGLPVNSYSAYRDAWESQLPGEYKVVVEEDGKPRERQIAIGNVHVVPQPFGTLYNRVLSPIGNLADRDLARRTIGLVDIGFKTTDLAVADQMEFIDRLSSSTTTGMATAYAHIADRLRAEYRLDKENWEIDEIVAQGAVRIAGKTSDISRLKAEAYERVARKVITDLESLWDYRDLDTILVTGGGGQALAEHLLPRYPNIELVDGAPMANVRGYVKLARHFFGEVTAAPKPAG